MRCYGLSHYFYDIENERIFVAFLLTSFWDKIHSYKENVWPLSGGKRISKKDGYSKRGLKTCETRQNPLNANFSYQKTGIYATMIYATEENKKGRIE